MTNNTCCWLWGPFVSKEDKKSNQTKKKECHPQLAAKFRACRILPDGRESTSRLFHVCAPHAHLLVAQCHRRSQVLEASGQEDGPGGVIVQKPWERAVVKREQMSDEKKCKINKEFSAYSKQ